ncbi:hypothetical protein MTO96_043241 [Rhipicephalus appendiculatus]
MGRVKNTTYIHDCYLLISPVVLGDDIMRGCQGISFAVLIGTVIAALIMCPDETSAGLPFGPGREQNEDAAQ